MKSNKLKYNNIKVTAKSSQPNLATGDKIVIQCKSFTKEIPAVVFSNEEAHSILKIVDKVEKATNQNVYYK